jgi:ribosomal protein S18 acetylase RimI-like enzyme
MELQIRPFAPDDRPACAAVLARLSDWFGIPESNARYLRELGVLLSFVAVAGGAIVGFVSLRRNFPESAEIEVLAVDPALHRRGVGARLVARLEGELAGDGARLLHVKTLGPSDPYPPYARTRAFYRALGFMRVFESDAIWGSENPTLVLVKPLPPASPASK